MKKNYIYIILSFLFILSCKNNKKSSVELIEININNFDNNHNSLIDIIDDFSFLSLKNIPKIDQIGNVKKVIDFNDNFFVFDNNKSNILVFDKDGNFKNKIGERGSGPGQYKRIKDFDISKEKGVMYILDNPYLLMYDSEGVFLKKQLLEFYPVKMGVTKYNNLVYNLPALDDDYSHLILSDMDGAFLKKNAIYPKNTEFIGNAKTGGVNAVTDAIYYNYTGTSTIHKVSLDLNLTPIIKFDLGREMWLDKDKNDVWKFRNKYKEKNVTFLYNNYSITDEWIIFEYKKAFQDKTLFGHYNFKDNQLYTKESFDNESIVNIFSVPVGLDKSEKFISSLDYEVFNEYVNNKESRSLIEKFDSEFNLALDNLSLENTTILTFYTLTNEN